METTLTNNTANGGKIDLYGEFLDYEAPKAKIWQLDTEINGIKIQVDFNEYAENPLSWDYQPHFLSTHRQYFRTDEYKYIKDKKGNEFHISEFGSHEQIMQFFKKNDYIFLKIGIYEHSGRSLYPLNETDKNDDWDSGIFGYFYLSKNEIREARGIKKLTAQIIADELELFERTLKIFNAWMEGEVYTIYINGESESEAYGDDELKAELDRYSQELSKKIA